MAIHGNLTVYMTADVIGRRDRELMDAQAKLTQLAKAGAAKRDTDTT